MNFSSKIVELRGSIVFHLIGKLINEGDSKELNDKIDQEIQAGQSKVIFDLSELTHCNSSGLNVLIRSLTKTRTAGGDTFLCAVNEDLNKLFQIAKVNEIFSIYPNTEDALKQFNK